MSQLSFLLTCHLSVRSASSRSLIDVFLVSIDTSRTRKLRFSLLSSSRNARHAQNTRGRAERDDFRTILVVTPEQDGKTALALSFARGANVRKRWWPSIECNEPDDDGHVECAGCVDDRSRVLVSTSCTHTTRNLETIHRAHRYLSTKAVATFCHGFAQWAIERVRGYNYCRRPCSLERVVFRGCFFLHTIAWLFFFSTYCC